jgi:hypothetical protein
MRLAEQLGSWAIVYFIALLSASLGATLFPFCYAFMVRWWETAMGRYMMYKGIVLALALDFVVIRIFFPSIPAWVSLLLMIAIAVMVWWYFILFVITYVKGKKAREEARTRRREDRVAERKV